VDDVSIAIPAPDIEPAENGWGLVSADTGATLELVIEPVADSVAVAVPGTRSVAEVVDVNPSEVSERGYWTSVEGSLVDAENPALVSAVIFDEEYGIWIPLLTEYLADADLYRFFSPHFSWTGFVEWVNDEIVQPVGSGLSSAWNWSADQVKNLVDRAWSAVLATRDSIVDAYEFVKDITVGWLGIGGAEPPTCLSPPDVAAWELVRTSASDDALFSCVDQVADDRLVVRLANNRPYGMIVSYDGDRATGQNISWPSLSVFNGQTGFQIFFDTLQDVVGEVFDSSLEMAYLPPGGEFSVEMSTGAIDEFLKIEVSSNPSLTAFDLVATLTWEIWGSSAEIGEIVLLDCGAKALEAIRDLVGQPSAEGLGSFLNSSFEAFVACVKAAGFEMASLVFDFARDSLKAIIALGRNLWDTDWSDASLDRSVAVVRVASTESLAAPTWEELRNAEVPAICDHEPTTLVDWRHVDIPDGRGRFELLAASRLGGELIVSPVDRLGEQLTVVAASCNAGGVAWPNQLVFFGPGPTYVADSGLFEFDWSTIGSTGPAREGFFSIEPTSRGVLVTTAASAPTDGACCPTLVLFAEVGFDGSGNLSVLSAESVNCVNGYDLDTCGPDAFVDDGDRGCEPGYQTIFSGAADGGFEVSGGSTYGPILVSVCRDDSGALHYYGVDLETDASIVLPACQVAPEVWLAENEGWQYFVVDERSSDRGVPGVLTLVSPSDERIVWNLWNDVLRSTDRQNAANNRTC